MGDINSDIFNTQNISKTETGGMKLNSKVGDRSVNILIRTTFGDINPKKE